MQIFAPRAVENDAMRVNERQFAAVPSKGDGSALHQLDAKAIREDALHAGGFNPGNLFKLTPAGVQGDAQDTPVAVVDKLLEHRFAADHAIAVQLDLIRLEQLHGGRIYKELHSVARHSHTSDAGTTKNQHPPIERPAAPAEFLAADFNRLLAAQVTRFIVGNQLGPVGIGLCRRRRVSRYGLHAFQTTTSFSRLTP